MLPCPGNTIQAIRSAGGSPIPFPRISLCLIFLGLLALVALVVKLVDWSDARFGPSKGALAERPEAAGGPQARPASPRPFYPPFFWRVAGACMVTFAALGVWLLGARVSPWAMVLCLLGMAVVLARFCLAAWKGRDRRAVSFGAGLALVIFAGLRLIYAAFVVADFTIEGCSPEPYLTAAVYFAVSLALLMFLPRIARRLESRVSGGRNG